MEKAISLYLYLDFLLDARFPKNFVEHSDNQMIMTALKNYFDQALDSKGFDFQKFEKGGLVEVGERRPFKYEEIKRLQCNVVANILHGNEVFRVVDHPFFGRQCEVDSEKFIKSLELLKNAIRLVADGPSLQYEIGHWGMERFKSGLSQVYRVMGGYYNDENWVDFADAPQASYGNLVLPSPNTIVAVDRDSPEVIEIHSIGADLISQLHSANDLGELSRDEASAAANEVRQILTAFEGSRIRKRQVFEVASATLKWIASKSGEALVGALATALLAAIAAYLGFRL